MARIARVVAIGFPHHITQRGNRRQQTFFNDGDCHAYIRLMAQWCAHFKVEVWAYCLMPNHMYLIAVPRSEEDSRRAIGEVLRHHERTGRPLGEEGFVAKLEKGLGRILHRRKPGSKRSIQN
ncbi:MAG: transposase [Candidatus Manganitrophus sp. SA1]|nr:transposase [Candidatus Manganitrophus morganii]